MKVLHILNELNPSGAEVMLEIAAPIWKKKQIELFILATGFEIGEYQTNLEAAGYNIIHLRLYPRWNYFISLIRLVRKQRFDIIHIHSEGASFISASAVKLSSNIPVIRTVHHIWPFQRILPFVKRYIFRFVTNKVFKITSVSNSISGRANEEKLYHVKNLLIPNWYNDSVYYPTTLEEKKYYRKSLNVSENTLIIVSLGKNWPYKNFDLIVKAIASITGDFQILYLQIGPTFQGNQLEDLTKKLGIQSSVKILGSVNNPFMYLQMADVFIMPSSNEGFGNAAVEALACGLPCILSDVPALNDLKQYFLNIYWIQPTIKDICKALLHFSQMSYTQRYYLASDNAKLAKQLFGIEINALKYHELYLKLLKN